VLTEEAAQKLTYFVGLQWEDADRQVLEPLVDAALVWVFPDQLAQIALPIVETLWEDELREDIERALDDASSQHDEVACLAADAKADLAAGPRRSRLARAIVEQGAFELAGTDMLPMHCLLCLEEHAAAAPVAERTRLALRVAQLARRVLDVPSTEVSAALSVAAVQRGMLRSPSRPTSVGAWLGSGSRGWQSSARTRFRPLRRCSRPPSLTCRSTRRTTRSGVKR